MQSPGSLEESLENLEGLFGVGKVLKKQVLSCRIWKIWDFSRIHQPCIFHRSLSTQKDAAEIRQKSTLTFKSSSVMFFLFDPSCSAADGFLREPVPVTSLKRLYLHVC